MRWWESDAGDRRWLGLGMLVELLLMMGLFGKQLVVAGAGCLLLLVVLPAALLAMALLVRLALQLLGT